MDILLASVHFPYDHLSDEHVDTQRQEYVDAFGSIFPAPNRSMQPLS